MVGTIRNILLVMTFSGTLIFFLWNIIYKFLFLKFKSKWLHHLLIIAIPFYLLPVPLFKYLFLKLFLEIGITPPFIHKNLEGIIDKTYLIVNQEYKSVFSFYEKLLLLCILSMAFISFLRIIRQIRNYLYLKQVIIHNTHLPLAKWELKQFDKMKCQMKMKRKIKLIKLSNISDPFSVGIIHPIIAIPNKMPIQPQMFQMILVHELAHVKHKDSIFSFIAHIILSVHWFNPFCCSYLNSLKESNELYSDETVTETFPNMDKLVYCSLIIQLSTEKNAIEDLLTLNFTGNKKKQLKRRIDHLINSQYCQFRVPLISGIIILYLGLLSTFIYANSDKMYIDSNEHYYYNSEENFLLEIPNLSEEAVFETSFIDNNHNIYQLDNMQTKLYCNHSFVEGTKMIHKKSDKNCKIYYYNAQRCKNCGQTTSKDLFSTRIWKVCPH